MVKTEIATKKLAAICKSKGVKAKFYTNKPAGILTHQLQTFATVCVDETKIKLNINETWFQRHAPGLASAVREEFDAEFGSNANWS